MRADFVIKSVTATAGGAERVLRDISSALAERGHDVRVLSFDPPGSPPFYHYPSKVEQIRLGVGDTRSSTGHIEAGRRIAALRRALRRHRPDVAVGFMHSSYVPLTLAARSIRVPVVASEHNAAANYATSRLQRVLISGVQPLVQATTVLSESIAAGFPEAVKRKAVVVPDPVAPAQRTADLGRVVPRRRLLAVGSLTEQKDHVTLLRAFGLLADRFPEWDLRIVGDGPLRNELERQVRGLGLLHRVELPGATDHVDEQYLAADLFAIPSRYEGFGLVTAEAMAHGLPCVGFRDCPGTNELLEHGHNGLLVDGSEDRARALASGLSELMVDQERRATMGARGPASVRRFSPDAIVNRWEEVLTAITTGGAGPLR